MSNAIKKSFARRMALVTPFALAFALTGCFDDGGNDNDELAVMPTPTPIPTSSQVTIDVSQCLNQEIPGLGITVAQAAIPDVLTIDPAVAPGFPDGPTPPDPVVDVVLAVLLLDLSAPNQGPGTFASIPVNPGSNDRLFPGNFPFLAGPQGSPPAPAGIMGSNFNFRTDAESEYVRVDRMAFPALATALIPSGDAKLAYNDADPGVDVTGEFADEITGQLVAIATALQDDLTGLGLNTCAD